MITVQMITPWKFGSSPPENLPSQKERILFQVSVEKLLANRPYVLVYKDPVHPPTFKGIGKPSILTSRNQSKPRDGVTKRVPFWGVHLVPGDESFGDKKFGREERNLIFCSLFWRNPSRGAL